ncbi:ATP-binding protein, partial [[Clostridium] innocuum]|nr:ATP-binding protein [[Clostridium] innocuum]
MPERKLNENYWNKYRYYKNDKLIRDGIKFEDLIEQLLQFEYGKRWKRTRKSHDDNRDFYLIDKDILKWAECKNYEETIAMSTIAPTLVMAQIYDVSKIIFFSYSKINQRAQTKLYSFAEKTGKSIQIYDADLLDGLIIKHRNLLSPRFKPDNEMIITDSVENLPKTNFYFIKTPVLGSTLDNRDLCNLNKIKKIQYNVIFEICFVILNNSLIDDYHITVSLHPDYYENNCYYTIMDVDLKNDNPVYDVHVDSASGIVQRIFLKSNKFKKNLLLPVFRVEIYKNEKLNLSYTSEIVKVNNIWIGKTVLIGEQYRHILNKFEENLIGNDSISCLLVHGNSGTGKTRLLNESIDILF